MLQEPVVHGILVASMFSAIIGNAFPGSIYLSQTLKFVAPVPGLARPVHIMHASRDVASLLGMGGAVAGIA